MCKYANCISFLDILMKYCDKGVWNSYFRSREVTHLSMRVPNSSLIVLWMFSVHRQLHWSFMSRHRIFRARSDRDVSLAVHKNTQTHNLKEVRVFQCACKIILVCFIIANKSRYVHNCTQHTKHEYKMFQ